MAKTPRSKKAKARGPRPGVQPRAEAPAKGIAAVSYDLQQQIKARRRAEAELRDARAALKAQTKHLEEARTAFKVLLRHREQDRSDLEDTLVANVKGIVLPYIEMLKQTRLNDRQRAILELVENHLTQIISPFLRTLTSAHTGLTPREIQIADLVKEGKTTKEIAALINISARAVEFHRYNIRSKLGLKNRKANLRSRLLSMT
ncbi:MAG: helix-turn-helix transcriptional regulator [Deltaproteobacteria bacterium]|nr:helix-turn-helix transcriptional regulator [Deltaproteobacteria bacterium]